MNDDMIFAPERDGWLILLKGNPFEHRLCARNFLTAAVNAPLRSTRRRGASTLRRAQLGQMSLQLVGDVMRIGANPGKCIAELIRSESLA
jgi:hypothetical protein